MIEDVVDLRALLEHSTIFINMLSTMSLDALNFNKPVINPAFGNSKNELYDDQRFLLYKHIQHVVESKATAIVIDEIEFLNGINSSLENSSIRKEQQKNLIQLEIGRPLVGTSKRIVDVLLKWS